MKKRIRLADSTEPKSEMQTFCVECGKFSRGIFVVGIIRAVKREDGVGVSGRKRMLLLCDSNEEHKFGGMQDFIMIEVHAAEQLLEEVYFEVAYYTDDKT